MFREIEFNSNEHMGFIGQVFFNKNTGESLKLHSTNDTSGIFINLNDKRAYQCSLDEVNQLIADEKLVYADYSVECYSMGTEKSGNLEYCFGVSTLLEAHFRLFDIADSFDKHAASSKEVYITQSQTLTCLVNENTMAESLIRLQLLIPRHRQFQPSAINVQQLTTGHKPDDTGAVSNKSTQKL